MIHPFYSLYKFILIRVMELTLVDIVREVHTGQVASSSYSLIYGQYRNRRSDRIGESVTQTQGDHHQTFRRLLHVAASLVYRK